MVTHLQLDESTSSRVMILASFPLPNTCCLGDVKVEPVAAEFVFEDTLTWFDSSSAPRIVSQFVTSMPVTTAEEISVPVATIPSTIADLLSVKHIN